MKQKRRLAPRAIEFADIHAEFQFLNVNFDFHKTLFIPNGNASIFVSLASIKYLIFYSVRKQPVVFLARVIPILADLRAQINGIIQQTNGLF